MCKCTGGILGTSEDGRATFCLECEDGINAELRRMSRDIRKRSEALGKLTGELATWERGHKIELETAIRNLQDARALLADKARRLRGLRLAASGMVRANGAAGQYYVDSDTGDGRYLAATVSARCGERCTCPDHTTRGARCKHVYAAMAWAEGRRVVAELAERTGRTYADLADWIAGDLDKCDTDEARHKAEIVLKAARALG